ncbi:unnamed protein product [Schistocephalus solidus]|uniref:CCR4-NOT transcription complex subunit 2 n=1 Tax=Schistocephalus solidus TaxID=70667 RepID=A0A183T1Q8_SCHSO|nr:unnamed protein product [Schistocephalus solidus]
MRRNLHSLFKQKLQDLSNFCAQIKSLAPGVLIEALANFDETTLRPFALQNVDSLTTRKLCNGYPLLDFKLTYTAFDGPDSAVITSSLKRAAPELHQTAQLGLKPRSKNPHSHPEFFLVLRCLEMSTATAYLLPSWFPVGDVHFIYAPKCKYFWVVSPDPLFYLLRFPIPGWPCHGVELSHLLIFIVLSPLASEANELSADTDTIKENNGHDVEAAKRARNEENTNDTSVKVNDGTNVGMSASPTATPEPVNKQKEDTVVKLATLTSTTVSTNRVDNTGSSGKSGQVSGNRYTPRNRGYRTQQQQHNRNQQMQRFGGNTPVRQQQQQHQGGRLSPSRRRGTDNQREISPPHRQGGGGGTLRSSMHQETQLQMSARILSPSLAMRQGGQVLANSMALIGGGGGGGQSSPGNAFRMPLPQRLSGSGQGQSPNQMMSAQLGGGGAFGGMSQQQSFGSGGGGNGGGNNAWPMLSSAAAQGLRMAGLQHQQQQCRGGKHYDDAQDGRFLKAKGRILLSRFSRPAHKSCSSFSTESSN